MYLAQIGQIRIFPVDDARGFDAELNLRDAHSVVAIKRRGVSIGHGVQTRGWAVHTHRIAASVIYFQHMVKNLINSL